MKKFLKITLLVLLAAGIIGTFVFLWMKSRPKVVVYETVTAEVADLQKTTVATGKVEPRDEILIKPQISGIIDEVYKEAGQSIRKGEVIAKVKVILPKVVCVWQKSMRNRHKQTLTALKNYSKTS